jgi:hypothetical protein
MLETVESCKISHGQVGAGVTLCHSVDFAKLNSATANGAMQDASLEFRVKTLIAAQGVILQEEH